MTDITITAVVGLALGLVTGYFFEWRNSRATRRHNQELQEQLFRLRESIYAVGRGGTERSADPPRDRTFHEALFAWVHQYQGPDGRLLASRVYSRFIEDGIPAEEVATALAQLSSNGRLKMDNEWVVVP